MTDRSQTTDRNWWKPVYMAGRSWWEQVYSAGKKAALDKQPSTPPNELTEDQKEVWLAGYHR